MVHGSDPDPSAAGDRSQARTVIDSPAALAHLLGLVNDTITVLDVDGTIRWINHDDTGGILGYGSKRLVGHQPWEYAHPRDVPLLADLWEQLLARPGATVRTRARVRAADGSYQDAEGVGYNLVDVPGIEGIVLVTRNVSTQVMAGEVHAGDLGELVEQATDVAVVLDPALQATFVSRSTQRTLGLDRDAIRSIDDLLHWIVPAERLRFEEGLEEAHDSYDHRTLELQFRSRSGELRTIALRVRPHDTTEGIGLAITGTDVTAARRTEAQLRHQALHDPLTDLPNRVLCRDRLEHACSSLRRGGVVLVAYIDVDHFKVVNDRYGHATGDAVLVELARRFEHALRATDTVARVGGDEFVAIAHVSDAGHAGEIVTRLLDSADEPMSVGDTTLQTTVSIGYVTTSTPGDDAEELVRRADATMYRAKQRGRNRIQRGD